MFNCTITNNVTDSDVVMKNVTSDQISVVCGAMDLGTYLDYDVEPAQPFSEPLHKTETFTHENGVVVIVTL